MSRDEHHYDVAVVGGSLGGVAAALSACDEGATVALTERTGCLGGQLTSQGVSAPDENPYIEEFSGTARYDAIRQRIRQRYHESHEVIGDPDPLNPGNCWVSQLGFEPEVAVAVIDELLAPYRESGALDVFLDRRPVDATVTEGHIESVTLDAADGETSVHATQFLDATELGVLLPLTGTEYVTGAESIEMTGEPDARPEHHPEEVQAFTYTFAVEHRPGEDHVVDPPEDFDRLNVTQPYTFEYKGHDNVTATYRMFEDGPNGEKPFWTYRRLVDSEQFADVNHDIAIINWSSNDFYSASLLDKSHKRQQEILRDAKRLSKGFLHWLQTEAPRDDGNGTGYPGLKLRPDVMGTNDGFSKFPYIRESRRIVPEQRVVQTDVTTRANDGARARNFTDSVGIGLYGLDVHQCVGVDHGGVFESTRPFQIPLGALIPTNGPSNLLPACKNLGVTHITNGCYRLHPIEWTIGESAGVLAAQCAKKNISPQVVYSDIERRNSYQYSLVADHGIPIAWTTDVPEDSDVFVPTQLLYAKGAVRRGSDRYDRLDVHPDDPLSHRDLRGVIEAACDLLGIDAVIPTNTNTTAIADRDAVEMAITSANLPARDLSPEPVWREVCQTIAPVISEEFQ